MKWKNANVSVSGATGLDIRDAHHHHTLWVWNHGNRPLQCYPMFGYAMLISQSSWNASSLMVGYLQNHFAGNLFVTMNHLNNVHWLRRKRSSFGEIRYSLIQHPTWHSWKSHPKKTKPMVRMVRHEVRQLTVVVFTILTSLLVRFMERVMKNHHSQWHYRSSTISSVVVCTMLSNVARSFGNSRSLMASSFARCFPKGFPRSPRWRLTTTTLPSETARAHLRNLRASEMALFIGPLGSHQMMDDGLVSVLGLTYHADHAKFAPSMSRARGGGCYFELVNFWGEYDTTQPQGLRAMAHGNESILLVIVVLVGMIAIAGVVGKFDIAFGHRSRLSPSSSELRAW